MFNRLILKAWIPLVLLCLSANGKLFSQIQFENNSAFLKEESKSLFPMGFKDLNGDYRDDILQIENARHINVYSQLGEISKTQLDRTAFVFPSNIWSVVASDLDNDGSSEIIVSGVYDGTRVYTKGNNGYDLKQNLPEDIYAQGANFVDIDNDGLLDFFICHDEGANLVYRNDGSQLNLDLSGFDFNTIPASDNSGNYASEWIDFDDDGDLDLSIAKCRQIAIDETDPRRINVLHVNDGNGNFTEMASAFGLDIGWQSWVTHWGDVDNDGDLDCYIINHDHADQLFRNENGSFVLDEMFIGDFMYGASIQGLMRDFDNDGYLDVLITGPRDYILWNDGTGNFNVGENPFSSVDSYSACVGDFNSDGFLDAFVCNAIHLSLLGNLPDALFTAVPNGNNFVKFSLRGIQSNSEGVGAKLLLYGDWGIQRRDIKSGDGYGIVNSGNVIFGLGSDSEVDSLVVHWPSGIKDVYTELEINKQHLLNEGQCVQAFAEIQVSGDLILCPGDSTILSLDLPGDITWNNGATGNEIIITEPGSYFARIMDGNCLTLSEMLFFDGDPNVELPQISAFGVPVFCEDDQAILTIQDYDSILWSNGDTTTVTTVDQEGWYSVAVQSSECGSTWIDSVYVQEAFSSIPAIENDSIPVPGLASPMAFGDSIHWYSELDATELLFAGNTYDVNVEQSKNFWVSQVSQTVVEPLTIGEETHAGATFYSANTLNGAMIFDALDNFTLNAVSVFSDTEGTREIELRDASGTVLQSKIFEIPKDEWFRLELNFIIPQGTEYYLTTNSNTNFQNLGFISPRMIRSFDTPLFYPMVLDDVVSINTTSFGSDYYYYFYNWEIDQGSIFCESERVKVQAIVGGLSNIDESLSEQIKIFPNPSDERIFIDYTGDQELKAFEIFDTMGKLILSGTLKNNEISILNFEAGLYQLKLFPSLSANGEFALKNFIKL